MWLLCIFLYVIDIIFIIGTVSGFEEEPDPPASLLYLQAASALMVEHELEFPVTVQDAICLYAELVALIEAEI